MPYEFGRAVINNYSEKAGLAPVVFDHWLHRTKFICILCHVDIGFGMKTGTTGIKAADNMKGFYCGSCHNGKMASAGRKVFEACYESPSPEDRARCARCQSMGKNVTPEYDFTKFTEHWPKGRFGNEIDWEKAEEQGLIRPVDFLERVSIRRSLSPFRMMFSPEELKRLITRCDALTPSIEQLDESQWKVYGRRLQLCRDLLVFVLESKEKK